MEAGQHGLPAANSGEVGWVGWGVNRTIIAARHSGSEIDFTGRSLILRLHVDVQDPWVIYCDPAH